MNPNTQHSAAGLTFTYLSFAASCFMPASASWLSPCSELSISVHHSRAF